MPRDRADLEWPVENLWSRLLLIGGATCRSKQPNALASEMPRRIRHYDVRRKPAFSHDRISTMQGRLLRCPRCSRYTTVSPWPERDGKAPHCSDLVLMQLRSQFSLLIGGVRRNLRQDLLSANSARPNTMPPSATLAGASGERALSACGGGAGERQPGFGRHELGSAPRPRTEARPRTTQALRGQATLKWASSSKSSGC